MPTLLETFPAVQFIVTTHSPLVIANAETASVRALVDNEAHTPEYAQGLDIETVIERVQGVDPTPDTANRRMLTTYMEMVHAGQGNSEEALGLRRRIEESLGGLDLVPELLEADAYLFLEGDG